MYIYLYRIHVCIYKHMFMTMYKHVYIYIYTYMYKVLYQLCKPLMWILHGLALKIGYPQIQWFVTIFIHQTLSYIL